MSVTDAIRDTYGATARGNLTSRDAGVRAVAHAFGYSADALASIPAEANMGLSCGNPIALANLKPGEVVVDLGSGGGLDVFLAARQVGPTGRAIGIDSTADMVARARRAAAAAVDAGTGVAAFNNVEFHHASIDAIPLPDACVDVVISNCVINLAPDKAAVFREMARVLRPGGRVAVSDIALKRPLPDELARDVMAHVGCIAGAIPIGAFERGLAGAGFGHVVVVDAHADLNAYAQVDGQAACCSPPATPPAQDAGRLALAPTACRADAPPAASPESSPASLHASLAALLRKYDINDYAASVKVFAIKP